MNKESNVYTIIFASAMVIVVGGLLAFIASSLKPAQIGNVKNEKMVNILQAIDPSFDGTELKKKKRPEITDMFNQYVSKRLLLDYDGNVISEMTSEDPVDPKNELDAFNLDPRKQYAKISKIKKECEGKEDCVAEKMKAEKIYAPLFLAEFKGQPVYIAHFSGKGLWDDIWGYVGVKPSRKINAAVFDHKAETPGLGSKITEDWFQDQYQGKRIATESDEYKPIKVYKPGKETSEYAVNGISGATFTGVGVDEMMGRALRAAHSYMKANVEIAGDTYVGEAEVFGKEINTENVKGEWMSENGTSLNLSNVNLQSDSLFANGRSGQVIQVTDDMLLIKWSDKKFVTTYSK